jgi:hypothetical protein
VRVLNACIVSLYPYMSCGRITLCVREGTRVVATCTQGAQLTGEALRHTKSCEVSEERAGSIPPIEECIRIHEYACIYVHQYDECLPPCIHSHIHIRTLSCSNTRPEEGRFRVGEHHNNSTLLSEQCVQSGCMSRYN